MRTFPLSTSPRVRDVVRHELRRRTATVVGRRELPASMVRITLGGDDLADFTSLGPEDHVKLFFEGPDGVVGRDYTPSEFRTLGASSGPELDVDFVVHGTDGPATAWASAATEGDELAFGGPRGSRLAPTGFRNALLIADPAGLPALRRWVRAFAGEPPTRAILFGGAEAAYLDETERTAALLQVVGEGHDLLETVRAQDVDGDTFVWAAGEATALVPVRRHLKELGLAKENRSLHGYWRRGEAGLDHHAPLDPTDPD
ncbi:siderophore-interacting protein [Amnibacterium kyonggiense]|uniref:NADPH-dependent ferric siderophore reductase n=1 Tax=Amnibacterium kyonggiense TaxID=595671 RepID=A0A4R7FGA2_9MICO|nr:siderophore-interacting protein [Amnibacterium kyonggiense]TDS75685.1 NADPH-dependent ferric siderophore reductase [Amnibacterium kyonggiense]